MNVPEANILLTANIVPRQYTVTYEQPMYGSLLVDTLADTEVVVSGSRLPYLTELLVTAEATDPIAYSVVQILANNLEIDNETTIKLEGNTVLSAMIAINRWKIESRVDGEGEIKLVQLRDERELLFPKDSVNHYDTVRIEITEGEGWMLYSLDVFGVEVRDDSSFVVGNDVDINVVFKEKEPLKFPAVFTPNGDGINDLWEIKGIWQVPKNKLEIYNRNEQRVYKVSPYQNDWEGTTNSGEFLPVGNYVYKFTVTSGKVYMGIFAIIRN